MHYKCEKTIKNNSLQLEDSAHQRQNNRLVLSYKFRKSNFTYKIMKFKGTMSASGNENYLERIMRNNSFQTF